MNRTLLEGCATHPLMNYLKALGLMRVASKQLDPEAKWCWQEGRLAMESGHDMEALIRFLQEDYSPSPLLGPWGARSGFWPKEARSKELLDTICGDDRPRFDRIRASRWAIEAYNQRTHLDSKPEKARKHAYIHGLRSWMPDDMVEWIDACQVIRESDVKEMYLLGTGGNEGSGSYSMNYLEAVASMLVKGKGSKALLESCLLGTLTRKVKMSPGQFDPFSVSNMSANDDGADSDSLVNPWDLMLALEGSLMFAGSTSRRLGHERSGASFPFIVRPSIAGSSTLSQEASDEFSWEYWMPHWSDPATFLEVEGVFREGRVEVGRRSCQNGTDFIRAIGGLGVDRGLDRFTRYARLERNGQNSVAVPIGDFDVVEVGGVDMLTDLDRWLQQLRKSANSKGGPESHRQALRSVEDAMFRFCSSRSPNGLQDVLRAVAVAEMALSRSSKGDVNPLQGLSPEWAGACDDGSAEFMLALSLATIMGEGTIGGIRCNLEPVMWEKGAYRWREGSPSCVWSDVDLATNLVRVLERRLVEARMSGLEHPPLDGAVRADMGAVAAMATGHVDEAKVTELFWGLSCLNQKGMEAPRYRGSSVTPFIYRAIKSNMVPGRIALINGCWTLARDGDISIRYDPGLVGRVLRDRGAAVSECLSRLRSAGIRPIGNGRLVTASDEWQCRLVLAACLVPIWQWDQVMRGLVRYEERSENEPPVMDGE